MYNAGYIEGIFQIIMAKVIGDVLEHSIKHGSISEAIGQVTMSLVIQRIVYLTVDYIFVCATDRWHSEVVKSHFR